MRVLFFSRDYTTHDRRFLLKLEQSTHEIYFLRLEDDGMRYESRPLPPSIHVVEWAGGKHRASTPESWLKLMPSFEEVLDAIRPDVVHAGPVQSCGFMAALTGFRPIIVMSWGSDILVDADRDEFWRWMTRYTLARSDLFICDNQVVRLKTQQIIDYPDERIVQFPWGIDLKVFCVEKTNSPLRQQLGWQDNCVVLSTRAWQQIYGIEVLLEAFRQAHREIPQLRLMLLGNGPLAPYVQQFIETCQLQNAVYCPGLVSHEQLPDYFRAADLYITCAYSDGTSISLLEAIAMHLPLIVTDTPSNREWVTQGMNGWLNPAGDSASFARALIEVASLDQDTRQSIAHQNQQIAQQRANWDLNSQRLLDAYEYVRLKGIGTR